MIDIGSEIVDVPSEGDPGDVNVNVDFDPSIEGGSIDVNRGKPRCILPMI